MKRSSPSLIESGGIRTTTSPKGRGIRVPVKKSLILFMAPKKGPVNFFRGERGGQRQISAGDSLGQAKQVRPYVLMLTGEHFSGPSKSRGHFVGDQERSVLSANPLKA